MSVLNAHMPLKEKGASILRRSFEDMLAQSLMGLLWHGIPELLLQHGEVYYQQSTGKDKKQRCNSCKVKPRFLSFKKEGKQGNQ